jgi:hypothetical protein
MGERFKFIFAKVKYLPLRSTALNFLTVIKITLAEFLQHLTHQLQELQRVVVEVVKAAIASPERLWQAFCDFMTSQVKSYARTQPEPAREPMRKGLAVSEYIPPRGYWTIYRFEV